MSTATRNALGLTTLASILAAGAIFGQTLPLSVDSGVSLIGESGRPLNSAIIFNNLSPLPTDRFDTGSFYALKVVGKDAQGQTEEWSAVAFFPTENVRAKVLLAAIGYISGTKKVNLGIYTDDFGTVGTLLPGGEGSTTEMPDSGTCCDLAKVTLPGSGVALTAGTKYWLAATTDDVEAPTFSGEWRLSHESRSAFFNPPTWHYPVGHWPAAQVRGLRMSDLVVSGGEDHTTARAEEVEPPAGSKILFTNLTRASGGGYTAGYGTYVSGSDATDVVESWQALPFTVKTDSHATVLEAAIGYKSGTKKVNLGIYSDDAGSVGTLLPGAQGTITDMPDFGDCCVLARVTLPGDGVPLSAGTQYWLVATPDNVNAPTFEGEWQFTVAALSAYTEPEIGTYWTSSYALQLAAEIRGTSP